MNKIKLTQRQKAILTQLRTNEYPTSIPEEDVDDIYVLMEHNLVKTLDVSDKSGRMMICPELTDTGKAYIAINPKLNNPSVWDDTKYIINTIISIAALIVAIIALFKK